MSLITLVLVGLALVAIQFGLMAAYLWIAGRLLKLDELSFGRAILAAVVMGVGSTLLTLPMLLLVRSGGDEDSLASAVLFVLVLLQVLLPLFCVRWIFGASYKKATLIAIVAVIPTSIAMSLAAQQTKQRLVEAFVVPTGAMAPTIIGAHADLTCSNCGYSFHASLSHRLSEQRFDGGDSYTFCQNCGQQIMISKNVPLRSGDRVLVSKRETTPKRWDIILFENPDSGEFYTSRTVGLPGEAIEIAGGDIYSDGSIVRKHPLQQQDLWLLVHDNEHRPTTVDDETPRWQSEAGSSWSTAGSGWSFGGSKDEHPLTFIGPINDRLAYNTLEPQRFAPDFLPLGDVKLECALERLDPDCAIRIHWSYATRGVVATVHGDGLVELDVTKQGAEPTQQDQQRRVSLRLKDRPLVLAIRDGQASLLHGEETLLTADVGPSQLADFEEEPGAECSLTLTAEGGQAAIQRLTIHRDVYYRTQEEMDFFDLDRPETPRFPLQLDPDEYLVLGDNSTKSLDSRFFGPLHAQAIHGITRWIYWPTERWREFE